MPFRTSVEEDPRRSPLHCTSPTPQLGHSRRPRNMPPKQLQVRRARLALVNSAEEAWLHSPYFRIFRIFFFSIFLRHHHQSRSTVVVDNCASPVEMGLEFPAP